jgi:3-deoxy-D-manno-octulosonate 8-phosphate phosphatase (KDO 8-P phosphatase)
MKPSLVVFDFDGVLTDNRVLVFDDGREAVFCNRADGLAFGVLHRGGIATLILSTEQNRVVTERAKKLKVPVLQGLDDKAAALADFCQKKGIRLADVMYIGNDLNDWDVMKRVGYAVCPIDAHPDIKAICGTVLETPGGYGIVREVAERFFGLKFHQRTAADEGAF